MFYSIFIGFIVACVGYVHSLNFFSIFLLCLFKLWSICEVNISLDFSINIDFLMKPTAIVSHSYLCLIQGFAQVFW